MNPKSFNLSLKCRDGLSLCGPDLVFVSPTRISAFKYVPVVKITASASIFVPSSRTTPFILLFSTIKSSTRLSIISKFCSFFNVLSISFGYVVLSA